MATIETLTHSPEAPDADELQELAGELNGADAMQADNDDTAAKDLLGKKMSVLGRKYYPITLASITLMRDIESPLIAGVEVDKIANPFQAILDFLVLHSFDLDDDTQLDKAIALTEDRRALKKHGLRMAAAVQGVNLGEALKEVLARVRSATQTQVTAKAPGKNGVAEELREIAEGEAGKV